MKHSLPLLLVASILAIQFLAMVAPPTNDRILRIGVAINGATVEFRALDNDDLKPHVVPIESVDRLRSIFFSLECFVNSDCSILKADHEQEPTPVEPNELVPALTEEGRKLLGPFDDLIAAAGEVRFQIEWSEIKIPFDLLYFRGNPLFVTKRISYTVGHASQDWQPPPSLNWIGLLVSDQTADPQRAVFAIENYFPGSASFDIADFDLPRLDALGPVDFVAISGHGFVNGAGNGFIGIGNEDKLRPGSLTRLRPKLVYFDSCNLGISAGHLQALRDGGTAYAVAPILSNEAGDSSTATIGVFFSELAKGVDPITALFLTRSRLYARYADDDIRTMLWRAFPFRIYLLN